MGIARKRGGEDDGSAVGRAVRSTGYACLAFRVLHTEVVHLASRLPRESV
jgi:hypothetical protein